MINRKVNKLFVILFICLVITALQCQFLYSQNSPEKEKNPSNLSPEVLKEISQYKLAIIANPKNAIARNLLGYVYHENKMYMEALDEYSLAVLAKPKAPLYRNNLGSLYLELGNAIAAVKQLKIAVKLAPLEPTLLVNYAKALIGVDKYKEAIKHLKRARAIDDEYAEVRVVARILKKARKEFRIRRRKEIAERDAMLEKMKEAQKKLKVAQELERKKKEEENKRFGNLLIISIISFTIIILTIAIIFYWWNLPVKKIKRAHKRDDYESIIYYFENSPKKISDIAIISLYYDAIKETTFWKKRLDTLKTLVKHKPSDIKYYPDLFESHLMAKSSVKVVTSEITKFEKNFSSPVVRKDIYKYLLTLATNISGYLKIISDISKKYFKLEKEDFSLYKNIFAYNLKRNDIKEAEKILIHLSKIPKALNICVELEVSMLKKNEIASIGVISCMIHGFKHGKITDLKSITSYKSSLLKALKNYAIIEFPYDIKGVLTEYIKILISNKMISDAESIFEGLNEIPFENTEEIIEMAAIAFSIDKKDIGLQLYNRLFLNRPEMAGFLIEKLKEIIEQDSGAPNIMVHFLIAKCYYTIGNINQAILEAEIAYNYNIKDTAILKFFIQILIKANIKDKLLSTFGDLAAIEEDNYYKSVHSEILLLSKYYEKATDIYDIFIQNSYYDQFYYQKLLKTAAENQDWKLIESTVNNYSEKNKSFLFFTIKILEKIKNTENDAIIAPLLQKIYALKKDVIANQELLSLEDQVEKNLNNPSFIQNLVTLYLNEGTIDKANAVIIKALNGPQFTKEIVSHFFNLNLILGNTTSILMFIKNSQAKLNNFEEIVIQVLKSIININPFLFEAYGILSKLYLKKNHKKECMDLLEKLVLLNPRDNNSLMLLRKLQIEDLQNKENIT